MRTAIYGAGSLGIVLGAYLSKAGVDITLVHHRKEMVDVLNEKGARVTGNVEMTVPVRAVLPREMDGIYDVIFLMTKQLDNARVAQFLKSRLGENGVLCTMQNGLPEKELADILGPSRVLGCTVAWGATLVEDGVSRLTSSASSMTFGLGPWDGNWDRRGDDVKNVLETMCPVDEVHDLAGTRWSKLLINAAFSGLGTVIGGTFGDCVRGDRCRRLTLEAIQECVRTGRAAGITFAKVQGKDIEALLYYKNPVKKALALKILPLTIRKHAAIEPSMLQDIKKGKKCEIDAINGALCREGDRTNTPTPVNDRIVDVIHRIESGELKPGEENLKEFDNIDC